MIEDIIQISKEAGELIRNAFGKNHSIEFKTNELNLVTETDKASEKLITDFIKKKYPSHGILAEAFILQTQPWRKTQEVLIGIALRRQCR